MQNQALDPEQGRCYYAETRNFWLNIACNSTTVHGRGHMRNGVSATWRATSLVVALAVLVAGCAGPSSSPAATAKPAGGTGGGITPEVSQWGGARVPQGGPPGPRGPFDDAHPRIKGKTPVPPLRSIQQPNIARSSP